MPSSSCASRSVSPGVLISREFKHQASHSRLASFPSSLPSKAKTIKTLQESTVGRRVVATRQWYWYWTSAKPYPIRNPTPKPNERSDQCGVTLATRGTNKRVAMTQLDFHPTNMFCISLHFSNVRVGSVGRYWKENQPLSVPDLEIPTSSLQQTS